MIYTVSPNISSFYSHSFFSLLRQVPRFASCSTGSPPLTLYAYVFIQFPRPPTMTLTIRVPDQYPYVFCLNPNTIYNLSPLQCIIKRCIT